VGIDLSFVKEDSKHQAQGADSYGAVPDSNPWGEGGYPKGDIEPLGGDATEGGFYDTRDDLVGGTDTRWNFQVTDATQQSGANWLSAADTAAVVNSPSGLNGERAKFSGTMSQESLAAGSNPDTPYGH